MTAAPPTRARLWPHLRAALVLFHVACIFVISFPAPIGGMHRANWKVPSVQQDFEAWARLLHVSAAALEETLYQAATVWMSVRSTVARPFGPYVRWTGCDQPWRMFVGPVRNQAKLQIQARVAGAPPDAWETLFEERSTEHRWHEVTFAQERLRTQLSRWPWPGYRSAFESGCAYFARLAFAERPDVQQVRCRFWSAPSPNPEQARNHVQPQGAWGEPFVHDRPAR